MWGGAQAMAADPLGGWAVWAMEVALLTTAAVESVANGTVWMDAASLASACHNGSAWGLFSDETMQSCQAALHGAGTVGVVLVIGVVLACVAPRCSRSRHIRRDDLEEDAAAPAEAQAHAAHAVARPIGALARERGGDDDDDGGGGGGGGGGGVDGASG